MILLAEKTKLKKRNELVKSEYDRLKKIFANIEKDKLELVDKLIKQAARLKVLLDENWEDITEGGDYDLFSQSEKVDPYERERPIAKLYNSRDQSYQKVIRQLTDLLPKEEQEEASEYVADDLL